MPFYVDNSMLRARYTCSSKVWTRYIQHLTTNDERAELLSGKAGHAAIEAIHKGGTVDQGMKAFDDLYKTWGSQNVDPNHRLYYRNVRTIVLKTLEKLAYDPHALPYKPIKDLVEVPFEVPLDEHGEIIYMGAIDVVGQYSAGIITNENKFTGRISEDWVRSFRGDSQLSGYIYALKHGKVGGKLLNQDVMGAFVTAVELSKLPSDAVRKCKTHGVRYEECGELHAKMEVFGPFPREEAIIRQWYQDAVYGAKYIMWLRDTYGTIDVLQEVPQEGRFTNSCRWCEFQRLCDTGRGKGGVVNKLIVNVWDPRDRGKKVA